MNKLKRYLKESGKRSSWFAGKIGVSVSRLGQIVNQGARPSIGTAIRIEEETEGEVKIADLFHEGGAAIDQKPCKQSMEEYIKKKEAEVRKFSRVLLRRAIAEGYVEKPTCCELCKSTENLEAHHTDYLKPINVQWLCRKCQGIAHRTVDGIEYSCLFCELKFMDKPSKNRKFCSKTCSGKHKRKQNALANNQ